MNLLKDEVSLLVRKLAVPASVGTLFQTLYTIVDTFYAGKISPEALSALSKSFPIYFLIIAHPSMQMMFWKVKVHLMCTQILIRLIKLY